MFRHLFKTQPPSINSSRKAKGINSIRAELSKLTPQPYFPTGTKLYVRIVYINFDTSRARDIHNVFKPLFDALGKSGDKSLPALVYEDDTDIVLFEGIRLDFQSTRFEYVLSDALTDDDLDYIESEQKTCFLVEIQPIGSTIPSAIAVDLESFESI